MTLRKSTYGGVIIWNNMRKEMIQTRPMNPPSYNARFIQRLQDEYPDYTLVEAWKNG